MINWTALCVIEGELTGDGRRFEAGSVRWVDPPFPLTLVHGFDAAVVGNVLTMERRGNSIFATGQIDETTEEGQEALRRISDAQHPAFANGVSVEIDEMEAEVLVKAEVVAQSSEMMEGDGMAPMSDPPDDEGRVKVYEFSDDDEILSITDARVRALSLATVAAFADAKIVLASPVVEEAAVTAALNRIYQIIEEVLVPAEDVETEEPLVRVADLNAVWDEEIAKENTFLAIERPDGSFDQAKAAELFLWIDPDGDPADSESYSLGFTDVVLDELSVIPEGVSELPLRAEELLRGLDDVTDTERDALEGRICDVYAEVRLVHEDFPPCPYEEMVMAASGGNSTYHFPSRLFDDPQFSGPSGVTVNNEAGAWHLTGHLALWNTCHTAFDGHCVMPPASKTNYGRFMLHVVPTENGPLPVGKITVDTLHAGRQMSAQDTIQHYEHTGLGAAFVRVGEDDFGIWVAGVIPPYVTEEQARPLFEGAPLSGDWRWDPGSRNLELRGVLAVNIPGFIVPRVAMAASGHPASVQVGYDPRLERAIQTFRIAQAEAEMAGV